MLLLGSEKRELAGIYLRHIGSRCLNVGVFELYQLSDIEVSDAQQ